MNKKCALYLSVLLIFTGCETEDDRIQKQNEELIVKAETEVRNIALDPDSVKFRNQLVTIDIEKDSMPWRVVCGEYNAKNSYGAYTGFEFFEYNDETDELTFPAERSVICI